MGLILPILLLLLPSFCPIAAAGTLPTPSLANKSIPFQVGLLLAKSAKKATSTDANGQFLQYGDELKGEDDENKGIEELDGNCHFALANRLKSQLKGNLLNFDQNLLAQILMAEKREKICRIYSAQSAELNECIGQNANAQLHPIHLLLQSICGQFAEALVANGQCLSELQIGRLEGQCTKACQRQAESASMPIQKRSSNAKTSSIIFGSSACQLALCSINCFGTQLSECAEEVEPKGDPAQLKAMIDQLAGIQMLAGIIAQKGSSPEFVQSMLIGEQIPMECAQFIGKAVTSANFVAPHDAEPSSLPNGDVQQQQIPLERAKRAVGGQ